MWRWVVSPFYDFKSDICCFIRMIWPPLHFLLKWKFFYINILPIIADIYLSIRCHSNLQFFGLYFRCRWDLEARQIYNSLSLHVLTTTILQLLNSTASVVHANFTNTIICLCSKADVLCLENVTKLWYFHLQRKRRRVYLLGFVVVERSTAEHTPSLHPRLTLQCFSLLHQPTFALTTAEVLTRDPSCSFNQQHRHNLLTTTTCLAVQSLCRTQHKHWMTRYVRCTAQRREKGKLWRRCACVGL